MSDNPPNVVSLSDHQPQVDKELVATLGSLLSEARKGNLRSFAAIYISGDGEEIGYSHFAQTLADQIALEAIAPGIILTE